MTERNLQKKYFDLLEKAKLANGRKDTVSILHKAENIRSRITKKFKKNCSKCYGYGYRRTSIDGAQTCLYCFGKGYITKIQNH